MSKIFMAWLAFDKVSQFKPTKAETDGKLYGGKKAAKKEPLSEGNRN